MGGPLDPGGAEVTAGGAARTVRRGVTPAVLVLLPALFVAVVALGPVARLLWEGLAGAALSLPGSSGPAGMGAVWADAHLRGRILWSVVQAGTTCALALVLGLPVAWVLARLSFAGRRWVLRLLMLPFVVPTLVAAMGVLALLGPHGLVSGSLGLDLEDSPWLLIYGNLFFNLCLVVRAATDALGQVSASRLAAARTLGATPWRAFWRVEWPAIRLAVGSALCLVFLYCFAGMGLALVLGGQRWATAEVEIYTLVAHELRLPEASALAAWMLLLTGGVALAYAALERRLAQPMQADRIPLQPVRHTRQRVAVAAALAVLGVFCAAPLVAIGVKAVAGQGALATLAEVWQHEDTLAALWNTTRFSGMALVVATVLGLCQALAVHHWPWRGRLAVQASTFVPFVVSPVTVAFGLLLLYPEWTASLPLLVAAYALLAYPFVAKAVGEALASLPAHWAQAALTLGARPWRVFWRVTLPLVAPALRRGMAFAVATALGEFAVSLFLSRPEWTTLTTLIYQHLGRPGNNNVQAAHALALLLMVLALGVFALLDSPRKTSFSAPCHA